MKKEKEKKREGKKREGGVRRWNTKKHQTQHTQRAWYEENGQRRGSQNFQHKCTAPPQWMMNTYGSREDIFLLLLNGGIGNDGGGALGGHDVQEFCVK